MLKNTRLENTRVITFGDESKDIATSFATGMCTGTHYHSIVSGDYYVSSDHSVSASELANYHYYDITSDNSIVYYLTDEEMTKACNGQLTDDDCIAIINRIIEPVTETKTRG